LYDLAPEQVMAVKQLSQERIFSKVMADDTILVSSAITLELEWV